MLKISSASVSKVEVSSVSVDLLLKDTIFVSSTVLSPDVEVSSVSEDTIFVSSSMLFPEVEFSSV